MQHSGVFPDSPEERASRYQTAGLALSFLALLWFVVLGGVGADPRAAGLWYGAALFLAETVAGYGVDVERRSGG